LRFDLDFAAFDFRDFAAFDFLDFLLLRNFLDLREPPFMQAAARPSPGTLIMNFVPADVVPTLAAPVKCE
jgi:hypothetical protein